jgi:hypothetical protein
VTTRGIVVAVVLLLWVSVMYMPFLRRPVGTYLFVPKVLGVGYVPFVAAWGILLAGSGALVGAWWLAAPAGIVAVAGAAAMVRVGAVSTDLAGAPGAGWEERISADLRASRVTRWWRGRLPRSREPRLRPAIRAGMVLHPEDAGAPCVFRVVMPEYGRSARVVFTDDVPRRLLLDVMSFEKGPPCGTRAGGSPLSQPSARPPA